jgi:hypothetical protein
MTSSGDGNVPGQSGKPPINRTHGGERGSGTPFRATAEGQEVTPARPQRVSNCGALHFVMLSPKLPVTAWLTGVHARRDRAQNVPFGTVLWPPAGRPVGRPPGGERLGERRSDFGLPGGLAHNVRERRSGDPPCSAASPPGPRVLARWSFHTPCQETGSGKPTTGRRRNDLRAWPDCRLKLGHELHGRGLHMVWA